MRSALFSQEYLEAQTPEGFGLQNSKMLKVALAGGTVMARQGSMVAYQGQLSFDYQSAGGIGKMLKKAVTGEGVDLMRVSGQGDVFLADLASDVHVIELDGSDGFSVNGVSVLAFEPSLQWDIKMISGAGMFGGGLFNTYFTGSGKIAITTKGTPVVLTVDAPTYVDTDAVVAWSASLQTSIARSGFKPMAMLGRGSGEAFQMAFSGQGFVIVQPSENPPRGAGQQTGNTGSGGIGGVLGRLGG
ncbi:MAG: AIM24 family protein [Propionibacteriales bacterium]|nr:AIM24 family protein [Propionibacteriales bacterium]